MTPGITRVLPYPWVRQMATKGEDVFTDPGWLTPAEEQTQLL